MTPHLHSDDIRLNPAARVSMRRIGQELNPLVVIDDVLLDAEDLVVRAADAGWGPPDGTYYPGVNAPLPPSYLRTLLPVLKPTFARAFAIAQETPLLASGFFALATYSLEQFGPLQRIPHYDQPDPMALAMVHYLCRDQGGGTGFFRHEPTGFESVDAARREGYIRIIADELAETGEQLTGFAGPDTPNFTMIDRVEPVFNRLVLYRSNVLHCALFDGARLSDDARTGRLTANSFFSPRP